MAYCCSECNAEITIAEYNFSKSRYGQPLCREHQRQHNENKITHNRESNGNNFYENENDNSISNRESNYIENMIKGRIAETLIEELFLYLGYSVFRYGMENTVPGIMKLLKGVRSDVARDIRRMPDFVVQNPKTGDVFFIEVKFRKSESFKFGDDIKEDYPYENCYFVIVSKKHIKCITFQELREGKEITPTSRNYLGDRKEFELDRNVIIDFCNFAVKFFDVV